MALWQGQSSCFSLERIWEKRLESNKLRTLWWALPNCVWRAYDKWIAGDHLIKTVLTGWIQSTNLLLFEVLRQRVKLPFLCRWCHIIGRHTWIDKGSLAFLENCLRFPVNVLKIKWLCLEKGKCTVLKWSRGNLINQCLLHTPKVLGECWLPGWGSQSMCFSHKSCT